MNELIKNTIFLAHEFGQEKYVLAGGGNVSCKNEEMLFVKPSGIYLKNMKEQDLVPLIRSKMQYLYKKEVYENINNREELVQKIMKESIDNNHQGRPSVEAPVHDSFPQKYIVHTHPTIVNSLLCSKNAEKICNELFPETMWLDVTDPGYSLCLKVRELLDNNSNKKKEVLFIQNHGVFVAHEKTEEIKNIYNHILITIENIIKKKYLNTQLTIKQPKSHIANNKQVIDIIKKIINSPESNIILVSEKFNTPAGPLTPDHIVYSKAYSFKEELTIDNLLQFKHIHGYFPKIIETSTEVYALGETIKKAELALALAWDASTIINYAEAFGGVNYLDKKFADFIENWEVENYRRKLAF